MIIIMRNNIKPMRTYTHEINLLRDVNIARSVVNIHKNFYIEKNNILPRIAIRSYN